MAKSTVPQVVRSYLTQLEKALAGLPGEVSEEIVAGVTEELAGLDAAASAARIESLGDPEFIAAEARAEAATVMPAGVAPQGGDRSREPRWLSVLAALLVAFGGVVIPVIGWVVGLALMWMSKTWRASDKWIATLMPLVAVCMLALVFALTSSASGPSSTPGMPSTGDFGANPLIPGLYSTVWSSTILVIPVNAVVGIWLIWRAKRTWASDASPQEVQTASPVPRRPQASWYAPVTVLLIIGGGFVVPVVGWVAGVTMLWAADVWGTRDKWLGTLAGPTAIIVAGLAVVVLRLGGGDWAGLVWWHFMLLGGAVLPIIANVIVGIRLLRRSKAATQ